MYFYIMFALLKTFETGRSSWEKIKFIMFLLNCWLHKHVVKDEKGLHCPSKISNWVSCPKSTPITITKNASPLALSKVEWSLSSGWTIEIVWWLDKRQHSSRILKCQQKVVIIFASGRGTYCSIGIHMWQLLASQSPC